MLPCRTPDLTQLLIAENTLARTARLRPVRADHRIGQHAAGFQRPAAHARKRGTCGASFRAAALGLDLLDRRAYLRMRERLCWTGSQRRQVDSQVPSVALERRAPAFSVYNQPLESLDPLIGYLAQGRLQPPCAV